VLMPKFKMADGLRVTLPVSNEHPHQAVHADTDLVCVWYTSKQPPCTCPLSRRLLLRNHEALSALEASVTTSSGGAKQIVGEGNAWRRLLNLIMQLRKVVNHPFMLPDSEPRGEGTSSLQELLEASGTPQLTIVVVQNVCV
jgi:hypothetical protein